MKKLPGTEEMKRPLSLLKDQQGIALFLVLWVLALLSVIVGQFCHAMRTETNITRNYTEKAQARYIALAGLNMAINELVKERNAPPQTRSVQEQEMPGTDRWRINAENRAIPFANGWFQVFIDNESGKVDLNTAGPELLNMLLNRFDIPEKEKSIIVDSILDWRDPDDLHRLNGAENDYYGRLSDPYEAKNGDFDSIEELLLVRGVTQEIFYGGLKEMLTAIPAGLSRGNSTGININAASPAMLLALPALTETDVAAIVDFRSGEDFRSPAQLLSVIGADAHAGIAPFITFDLGPIFSVQATGGLTQSRTRKILTALVEIRTAGNEAPFRYISWMDGVETGGASL